MRGQLAASTTVRVGMEEVGEVLVVDIVLEEFVVSLEDSMPIVTPEPTPPPIMKASIQRSAVMTTLHVLLPFHPALTSASALSSGSYTTRGSCTYFRTLLALIICALSSTFSGQSLSSSTFSPGWWRGINSCASFAGYISLMILLHQQHILDGMQRGADLNLYMRIRGST